MTPSSLLLFIGSFLYSLTFNKYSTSTILVNYPIKGQRSPFIDIQDLWKKIQPEVELKISISILKYLYFVLVFN